MAGLFGTLNTATSGLRAQQTALQTTSHNVSNANTDGYSRQRVTMEAAMPQSFAGIGQVGTGVQISGVTRITDEYVTEQLRNENASLDRHTQLSDVLGQLEAIYNEPSATGLSSQLSEFFVSWSNLASNPELITSKTMVVRQSETFLDTMNHMARQMDSLSNDTLRQIEKDVLDFNSSAKQLDSLNRQIYNATIKGEMPNDLLDQQDRLLDNLTGIAGVKVTRHESGRAFIQLGEQDIVTEGEVNLLATIPGTEGGVGVITEEGSEPQPVTLSNGSILGLQDARTAVEDKLSELNTFAENLATAVNTIHSGGEAQDAPFFTIEPNGNAAATISVNQVLREDPSKIHTGKSLEETIPGDGSRAKAIADLQNTSLTIDSANWNYDETTMSFANEAAGSPLFNQYNEMVTDMGIIKQQSDNMVANQTDLTALLEQRQESMSGVDINEEVVNMIQYQSAFQANSRMISVVAEMLDTLINRTGV